MILPMAFIIDPTDSARTPSALRSAVMRVISSASAPPNPTLRRRWNSATAESISMPSSTIVERSRSNSAAPSAALPLTTPSAARDRCAMMPACAIAVPACTVYAATARPAMYHPTASAPMASPPAMSPVMLGPPPPPAPPYCLPTRAAVRCARAAFVILIAAPRAAASVRRSCVDSVPCARADATALSRRRACESVIAFIPRAIRRAGPLILSTSSAVNFSVSAMVTHLAGGSF